MRIAYFAECLLPGQDGVSRVVNRAAAYQRARGHALCWITAVPDPSLEEPQLSTRSVPVPGYAPYRMSLGWTRTLRARLAAFRPDVLHVHAPFWLGWTAARLARQRGVPCVATYHPDFVSYAGYHGAHLLAPLLRRLNRLVYNRCTLTLVPSRTMQASIRQAGIRRTRVLPHGVDTAAATRSRPRRVAAIQPAAVSAGFPRRAAFPYPQAEWSSFPIPGRFPPSVASCCSCAP